MAEIAIIGRDVTFTMGGQTVVGTSSKTYTINNELIETSTDSSNGYQEYHTTPGKIASEISITGIVQNYDLLAAMMQNTSVIYVFVWTFPDGSTITQNFAWASMSQSMEHDQGSTFEVTFNSSGAPTFVAGT